MCGICGFSGPPDEALLRKMAQTIVHRGPDEDGFYADGRMNLGMRRLSIIDLATGHQPITNERRTVWTVFNGEIYNYEELRRDLIARGHTFYTDHSDTEVIVHLYEEFGAAFPNKINGMFAIALWDTEKDIMLLVRDRLGVKPLFYAEMRGALVFGSEIKAILEHPSYRREMNFEAVYHYFSMKHVPAPLTAFKGIYALSPGEMLTYTRGRTTLERWWKVCFTEDESMDETFASGRIFTLLEEATRLRMKSDVPFGAYLSGGVDSSAIVALMSGMSRKPVKTFSLGYEDELKNKEADLFYARKVSEQYRTEHHEYIMSFRELIEDIGDVVRAFDQPFSGTISTFFLTKIIRKHVKVALSGDGADEIFGSYLSHRIAQPMAHYHALLGGKRAGGEWTDQEKRLFLPVDIDYLETLHRKSGGDEVRWRYGLLLATDDDKRKMLGAAFKTKGTIASTLSLLEQYYSSVSSRNPLNRVLEMELSTLFPDQVLAFVDFLSMAHSVEIRSPFLDYRLVEFVATIPGRLKIRDGVVKDILKRSVGHVLPEGIVSRPKEGFVLPVFDWMMDRMRGFCADVLSPGRLDKHGLLQKEYVNTMVKDYYAGNRSLAGRLWNMMMFQIWWERYFGSGTYVNN